MFTVGRKRCSRLGKIGVHGWRKSVFTMGEKTHSVVLMFVEWPILDPILAIGFTLFILVNVVRNIGSTLKIFLQGVLGILPPNIAIRSVGLAIPRL